MKKPIGLILILIGIFAGVATMNIDTSVEVSSQYTGIERVNNLGKMNDKQNYLFISCIIFLSGMVLVGGDTEEIQEELQEIKKSLSKSTTQAEARKVAGQTEVTESNIESTIKNFDKNP